MHSSMCQQVIPYLHVGRHGAGGREGGVRGGGEGWKGGMMEGGNDGRVEGWNDGMME